MRAVNPTLGCLMHGFYNRKMSHQFLCRVLKVSGACIQESQRTVKKKKKKKKNRERERETPFLKSANLTCFRSQHRGRNLKTASVRTDLLAYLREPPEEAGSNCNYSWGQRCWQQSFWELFFTSKTLLLASNIFEVLPLTY